MCLFIVCLLFLGLSRATDFGNAFLDPGLMIDLTETSSVDRLNLTAAFTNDNLLTSFGLVSRQLRCVSPCYVSLHLFVIPRITDFLTSAMSYLNWLLLSW
jgi:hypothetical protein